MATKVVTAPAREPVTLAEMKAHLRVDTSDDDEYILGLITMARTYAEGVMGRAFVTQTRDLYLDSFPAAPVIRVPDAPLVSVTSIKYYDEDETEATWGSSNYQVDIAGEPGRIVLASNTNWPTTTLRKANGVVIRYVCGSAVEDVSAVHKMAIKAHVAHLYEFREPVISGTIVSAVPMHVNSLWWHDRIMLDL